MGSTRARTRWRVRTHTPLTLHGCYDLLLATKRKSEAIHFFSQSLKVLLLVRALLLGLKCGAAEQASPWLRTMNTAHAATPALCGQIMRAVCRGWARGREVDWESPRTSGPLLGSFGSRVVEDTLAPETAEPYHCSSPCGIRTGGLLLRHHVL